jgi:hypothetical protein
MTPYRIHKEQIEENGIVTVLIPKFKNKIMIKILDNNKKPNYIKVKLEEFGSAAWLAIDGKKNVNEICLELQNKFGEKISPVYERVPKYLVNLYQQGFISFNEIKKGV